ncbi:hypothetical protein UlMin_027410 [Ulmus minor]
MQIKDETETNLLNLRRTIYLTIMSSVDFEEAGHKLLKIKLEPGQEMELCIMLLECCSREITYLRYYGLLGQRFCMINKVYQENFDKCFVQQYSMIHRLETNKLRNVAKFFVHLHICSALACFSLYMLNPQIFEVYGLGKEVVDFSFCGSMSSIGGLTFDDVRHVSSITFLSNIAHI